MRDIARVMEIEAVRAAKAGQEVALGIEDGKGVVILQDTRAPLLQREESTDLELLVARPAGFLAILQHVGLNQLHGSDRLRVHWPLDESERRPVDQTIRMARGQQRIIKLEVARRHALHGEPAVEALAYRRTIESIYCR